MLKNLLIALLAFAMLFSPGLAFAQTGETVTDEEVLVDDTLEEVEVEEIEEEPTGFGLFWRGVRERVSLTFTFDPVKKAEKIVKYAEERMAIAERIAEARPDDERAQQRVANVLERANALIAQAEERKAELLENPDDRARRALKNLANHNLRREHVLDRIEQRIPEDRLEAFQERRAEFAAQGRRLLNAINNENIPEEIRAHLEAVRDRVEDKAEEVRQFRAAHKELLEAARSGDEDAQARLENLRETRKGNVEEGERVRTRAAELRGEVRNGNRDAIDELRRLNGAEERRIQEHRENLKDRAANLDAADRAERRAKIEQVIQERKENAPNVVAPRPAERAKLEAKAREGDVKPAPVKKAPAAVRQQVRENVQERVQERRENRVEEQDLEPNRPRQIRLEAR